MSLNPTIATRQPRRSKNPLFDQLVNESRPTTGRPLAPRLTSIASTRLSSDDLTPLERETLIELGGTFARRARSTRPDNVAAGPRWPFHRVE